MEIYFQHDWLQIQYQALLWENLRFETKIQFLPAREKYFNHFYKIDKRGIVIDVKQLLFFWFKSRICLTCN